MALDPGFASPFSKSQKASLEIIFIDRKADSKNKVMELTKKNIE